MVRGRVLLGAVLVAFVAFTALALVAVFDPESDDPPASVVTANVSDLKNGRVLPIRVELPQTALPPHRESGRARVFFVRHGGQVKAFLGVSTHLGCALLVPGDPTYGRGFTEDPKDPRIEDPCGGSTYALDGRCVGGPCPRDLDGYAVQLSGGTAQIDLRRLIAGDPKTL
jgi:Rieske Fe-S protein